MFTGILSDPTEVRAMFGNFIKANYDFGVPWCIFEVGQRQVYVESNRGDPLFIEVRNVLKQWSSPDGVCVESKRESLLNMETA